MCINSGLIHPVNFLPPSDSEHWPKEQKTVGFAADNILSIVFIIIIAIIL